MSIVSYFHPSLIQKYKRRLIWVIFREIKSQIPTSHSVSHRKKNYRVTVPPEEKENYECFPYSSDTHQENPTKNLYRTFSPPPPASFPHKVMMELITATKQTNKLSPSHCHRIRWSGLSVTVVMLPLLLLLLLTMGARTNAQTSPQTEKIPLGKFLPWVDYFLHS